MRKEIPNLVLKIHVANREKGFWEDVTILHQDRFLMLIISELSEALEALRIDHNANVDMFKKSEGNMDFVEAFETYIKNSFQDEMADVCIRILDFCAGFDIKISIVQSFYEKELETLGGTQIQDIPSMLLQMTRLITDVKYNVWKGQYLGEVLGMIDFLMKYTHSDLLYFIEQKMKYNTTRPHKHNKSF